MRQIEMIAPFDVLRGNLSGRQELVYPTSNNTAWNAPAGKRSYARNYRATYIGARRSGTGKVYFAVKKKSASTLSDAAKMQMAVFGGAAAIYTAMLSTATLIAPMNAFYNAQHRQGQTMRQFYLPGISTMLRSHSTTYSWGNAIKISNPWYGTSAGFTEVTISEELLVKFWKQLHTTGTYFFIDNQTGIGIDGLTFRDLITTTTPELNVLNLTSETFENVDYLKYNGTFVVDSNGAYITLDDEPADGTKYNTSFTSPID